MRLPAIVPRIPYRRCAMDEGDLAMRAIFNKLTKQTGLMLMVLEFVGEAPTFMIVDRYKLLVKHMKDQAMSSLIDKYGWK